MRAWLLASHGQVLCCCDVSCDCFDHCVPKGLPIVARVVVVAAVAFVVCIVAGYSSPSIYGLVEGLILFASCASAQQRKDELD